MSLDDLVRRMWLEQRDTALALAQELVALAGEVDPSVDVVEHGYRAAHRLAGSLGMYGMPDGSELASLLEDLLKPGDDGKPGDDTWFDPEVVASIASRLRSVILEGPSASEPGAH